MWQHGWEGSLGKNGWLSLCFPPETVTSLLIDSNIKNKKLKKDIGGDGAPKIVFLASWLDCNACISEVKGLLFLYEPER